MILSAHINNYTGMVNLVHSNNDEAVTVETAHYKPSEIEGLIVLLKVQHYTLETPNLSSIVLTHPSVLKGED